jgi:hypothetical protein
MEVWAARQRRPTVTGRADLPVSRNLGKNAEMNRTFVRSEGRFQFWKACSKGSEGRFQFWKACSER